MKICPACEEPLKDDAGEENHGQEDPHDQQGEMPLQGERTPGQCEDSWK